MRFNVLHVISTLAPDDAHSSLQTQGECIGTCGIKDLRMESDAVAAAEAAAADLVVSAADRNHDSPRTGFG